MPYSNNIITAPVGLGDIASILLQHLTASLLGWITTISLFIRHKSITIKYGNSNKPVERDGLKVQYFTIRRRSVNGQL